MSKYKILMLALLLSGCATNQRCDPRLDTDFMSTLSCDYGKSVAQAQHEVDVARQDKTGLLRQLADLQVEQAQIEQRIRDNEAELSASEAELAAIQKRLAHAKGSIHQLSKEKSRLKKETQRITALKKSNDKQKQMLAAKRKQAENLQKNVDMLLYNINFLPEFGNDNVIVKLADYPNKNKERLY